MKKENLLKIFIRNERVEKEAATRPDISPFFGQGFFFYLGKIKEFFWGMSVVSCRTGGWYPAVL